MTAKRETMNFYGIEGGLPAATKIAVDNFNNLTPEQFAQLVTLAKDLQADKDNHELINGRILPLFYKLGLFVFDESIVLFRIPFDRKHIEVIWGDGLGWLMTLQAEEPDPESGHSDLRFDPPALDMTLQLLTAVLQGQVIYGANYWFDQGVTQKLIAYLIQFKRGDK